MKAQRLKAKRKREKKAAKDIKLKSISLANNANSYDQGLSNAVTNYNDPYPTTKHQKLGNKYYKNWAENIVKETDISIRRKKDKK